MIGDEFHEYNNDGTAQERAYHRLTAIGAMNMGLSGSLMAGYAKQLFRNLWSLSPRFRREYNNGPNAVLSSVRVLQAHGPGEGREGPARL